MFSEDSVATLDLMTKQASTWDEQLTIQTNEAGGLDQGCLSVYGVTRDKPFDVRYVTSFQQAEALRKGAAPTTATDDGELTLDEGAQLQLIFTSYMPLNAPCATIVANGETWIIQPSLNIMDVFVTLDGKPQEDGHICCGPPELSRDDAIAHVGVLATEKLIDSRAEAAIKKTLEVGLTSSSVGKPWASIVGDFNGARQFVLPVGADSLHDVLSTRFGDPKKQDAHYVPCLLARFATLLAHGSGSHELEIRIAPRGILTTSTEARTWPGNMRGPDLNIATKDQEAKLIKGLASVLATAPPTGVFPCEEVAGLTAKFKVTLPSSLTGGDAPPLKPPAFVSIGYKPDAWPPRAFLLCAVLPCCAAMLCSHTAMLSCCVLCRPAVPPCCAAMLCCHAVLPPPTAMQQWHRWRLLLLPLAIAYNMCRRRLAHRTPQAAFFDGDLSKHCNIALELSAVCKIGNTSSPGQIAESVFGKRPGAPSHVIIPTTSKKGNLHYFDDGESAGQCFTAGVPNAAQSAASRGHTNRAPPT